MSPPNNGGNGGLGSLINIGNTLQSIAQNIILAVTELAQLMPAFTSGQLTTDTLVFTGFVRVTGVSIITAGSPVGSLHDAANLGASATGNEIYPLPSVVGFYPLQMIFENGLVYKTGTSEKIAIFYVRS
jgi:hypothetical protein